MILLRFEWVTTPWLKDQHSFSRPFVSLTQDAETQRDRLKAYSYGDTLLCRSFDRFVLAFLRVPASLRENGFEDAVLFQVSHS
jgi:hypothetical protein